MRTAVFAVLAVGFALAACSTQPVHLNHPKTGAAATCGPYPMGGMVSDASAYREEACIVSYERQGYVRAN